MFRRELSAKIPLNQEQNKLGCKIVEQKSFKVYVLPFQVFQASRNAFIIRKKGREYLEIIWSINY